MNNKLLIVGSFPGEKRNIYGGISKSCKILIESNHFSEFEIFKLDSSQISNPRPQLVNRFFNAILRIIKLIYMNTTKRPEVVLIFCSDGFSSIEKGFMIILSKFFGAKVLIFPRAGNLIDQTTNNKFFKTIIKFLFKKADVFLAQGENWKNFAKNSLKIFAKKIQVINNWTATNELLHIGFNKKIKDNINIKILYVGWLEKEKGISELISAINWLIKKNKSVELILVGDGSIRKKTEKYVIDNKIHSHVKFTGWLNSDKINYHLKESDIFVLPSWQEGMPNALIEAVSSGIPSIASSVGVIPNYFTHLENILLIEPKNITNLQISIEKLIDNYDLRKKISNNGYIVAKNFFSEDKSLKLLSDIIKKLLNG